jgi:hypothetical protein
MTGTGVSAIIKILICLTSSTIRGFSKAMRKKGSIIERYAFKLGLRDNNVIPHFLPRRLELPNTWYVSIVSRGSFKCIAKRLHCLISIWFLQFGANKLAFTGKNKALRISLA